VGDFVEFLRTALSGPFTGQITALIAGLVVITVGLRLGRRAVNPNVDDGDARYRARKLVGYVFFALAAFYITLVFRERLGGLTLTLGIIGAGIAFALQEVFGSMAAWVAVKFGRFYRVGDRIEVGAVKGDVIDIGLLRTTLVEVGQWVKGDLYSGRIVRMANSEVFRNAVFNYSADFPFLWDEIFLPIRFESDRALFREILRKATQDIVGEYVPQARTTWNAMVNRYMVEPASVEPMITLVATDNWVEFTVRYVVDYRARRRMRDALFSRILDDVQATSGKVALASTTFELVGVPKLDVTVRRPVPGDSA
jgi:small-conductance mechanosensitive channel